LCDCFLKIKENTTTDLSINQCTVMLFKLVDLDRNKNFESNIIGF